NNKDAVAALLHKIADENPSFVLALGDLTYCGAVRALWDKFDELAEPLVRSGIPVYSLPGNHEYLGEPPYNFTEGIETAGYIKDTHWSDEYFARFPNAAGKTWYSKKWKDIAIITLNSNFSHLNEAQVSAQTNWYRNEL